MDYRNISRAVLFDKAIYKYNKSSILPLTIAHVQCLYSLHYLTRKKPTAIASDIRIQFIAFRRTKTSHYFILQLLYQLESGHLISHQKFDRCLYWSLTVTGHNALKTLERIIRRERTYHRVSTDLAAPIDLKTAWR
jgi:hypothetical protein